MPPVTHQTLSLAAPRRTGPNGMCLAIVTPTNAGNQTQLPGIPNITEQNNRSITCRENRRPQARSIRHSNPHHTLSIDAPKPTRLPPWEIFQRGPPEHQTDTSCHDPHRKIFTNADIRLDIQMLRCGPSIRTFAATAKETSEQNYDLRKTTTFAAIVLASDSS